MSSGRPNAVDRAKNLLAGGLALVATPFWPPRRSPGSPMSVACAVCCPIRPRATSTGLRADAAGPQQRLPQRQGPAPLTWDKGLSLAARAHAADMAVTGAVRAHHQARATPRPAASACWPATWSARRARTSPCAATRLGAVTPDQIMGQWRTSPGHRANLLAPGFTHVGYGVLRQGPRVIAVGAYAEVAARLAGPAPLRVRRPTRSPAPCRTPPRRSASSRSPSPAARS
jgi:hypothetical protein